MACGRVDIENGLRSLVADNGSVRSNTPQRSLFLELFTGSKIKNEDSAYRYLIERLETLIDAHGDCGYLLLLHPDFEADQAPFERLLQLLCAIMRTSRTTPGISIHKFRQRLIEDQILLSSSSPVDELKQKHLLFSSIGWLTCLYLPSNCLDQNIFRIETSGAKHPQRNTIDIAKAHRPLDEFLSAFGETLPPEKTATEEPRSTTDISMIKFHVSCLNAATLKSIAKIGIVWVDTISAHLDFDPTVPALYLFRSPAFCKSQTTEDSILSLFTKDIYTSTDQSSWDLSIANLMNEIILSYSLIFRDNRSSRDLYRSQERKRASISGPGGKVVMDPVLDRACGLNLPVSIFSIGQPVRETYHAESDFPILRKRLLKLHYYIDGIQPNRVSSLWTDRRDMRLWYTFWAVIVIGGISIIQSFVSIFLSAAQVNIAQKAFELQQQQQQQQQRYGN